MTGVVRPGEFLAIMGASGAGKTTLLNCLTFRNTGKLQISGERYLNGDKVKTDTLARISGYVQQDDLFISTLTVREHLLFQVNATKHNFRLKVKPYVRDIFRLDCVWTNIYLTASVCRELTKSSRNWD